MTFIYPARAFPSALPVCRRRRAFSTFRIPCWLCREHRFSQTARSSSVGGEGNPFLPPPPRPPPTSTSQQPQFSDVPFSSSASSPSVALSSPSAVTTTNTGLLSATPPPQFSPKSASSQKNAFPLGLVIGATFGGLVLGALIVTFFFCLWRRRAQRKARRSQGLLVPNQDKEKGSLDVPFVAPTLSTSPNAKVMNWMRHNTSVSVSTISSFSSPTLTESSVQELPFLPTPRPALYPVARPETIISPKMEDSPVLLGCTV
ncbi:hypothetical protein B0H13DRAFT_801102 [Mycena leptocephala]|nr:hypothetical protein B0H13DRAFT_801102 [Mycena leptocephala]